MKFIKSEMKLSQEENHCLRMSCAISRQVHQTLFSVESVGNTCKIRCVAVIVARGNDNDFCPFHDLSSKVRLKNCLCMQLLTFVLPSDYF